jgi:hypothetical protein
VVKIYQALHLHQEFIVLGLKLILFYSSSAQLTNTNGPLTLNGLNIPNAEFVFQIGTTLITATASNVILINVNNPCDIFWIVGSSATLGTNSLLEGTIIAAVSISFDASATLTGKALAQTGAVTLISNLVNTRNCNGTQNSIVIVQNSTINNNDVCARTSINGSYIIVNGSPQINTPLFNSALSDAVNLYNTIQAMKCDVNLNIIENFPATYTPGVYCLFTPAQVTGSITFDGQNNPDPFFFIIANQALSLGNIPISFING